MKKLFVIILCLLFIFNLSACNKTSVTSESNFNPIVTNSDEFETKICAFENCSIFKIENSDYCEWHTCKTENCNNMRTPLSEFYGYCEAHECEVENCSFGKARNTIYCTSHLCCVESCTNLKSGDLYCKDHTCASSGCEYQTKDGYKYCGVHLCQESRGVADVQHVHREPYTYRQTEHQDLSCGPLRATASPVPRRGKRVLSHRLLLEGCRSSE